MGLHLVRISYIVLSASNPCFKRDNYHFGFCPSHSISGPFIEQAFYLQPTARCSCSAVGPTTPSRPMMSRSSTFYQTAGPVRTQRLCRWQERPRRRNSWTTTQSWSAEEGTGMTATDTTWKTTSGCQIRSWTRPGKGSFALRDETMWYQTHGILITFNNGLGPLKTKSGGGVPGRR